MFLKSNRLINFNFNNFIVDIKGLKLNINFNNFIINIKGLKLNFNFNIFIIDIKGLKGQNINSWIYI